MNTLANAQPELPVDAPATRPMYWSVRRELWENRSIYMAPLIAAAVALFGYLISTVGLPHRMRALLALGPAQQSQAIARPYSFVAALLIATAFIVGVFYCLDALHGERRDRSILFWKSLPVSDRTTVLSKAIIPLVVLPLLIFVMIVVTQMIMLMLSTAVLLLGNGSSVAMLWARLPLFKMALGLLYALTAIALWHAPLYGWFLLVSGWARRATFLWAVLPPLAISAFERIAFHTSYIGSLLRYRLIGWFAQGFDFKPRGTAPVDPLTQLTPWRFLSTPGLWIGLGAAAIFLVAAVRLRRTREPI
ncbi:MAG TPA: ABC transporter permease [Thermoanaerobaculia bacterium]|jgi:ABC-2 type transport system permease protein|nr:ABC transporter permease [Thermoanaerobaculia bacterium]